MYLLVLLIRRRCGVSRPRRVLFGSLCIPKLSRTFPDDRDKQTSAKETQPDNDFDHQLRAWVKQLNRKVRSPNDAIRIALFTVSNILRKKVKLVQVIGFG